MREKRETGGVLLRGAVGHRRHWDLRKCDQPKTGLSPPGAPSGGGGAGGRRGEPASTGAAARMCVGIKKSHTLRCGILSSPMDSR